MSQHGFVYCVRFTLYHKYKWFDDYDYDDAKKKVTLHEPDWNFATCTFPSASFLTFRQTDENEVQRATLLQCSLVDRWIAPWQTKKNRQTVSLHTEVGKSGDRLSPCILMPASHTGIGLIE